MSFLRFTGLAIAAGILASFVFAFPIGGPYSIPSADINSGGIRSNSDTYSITSSTGESGPIGFRQGADYVLLDGFAPTTLFADCNENGIPDEIDIAECNSDPDCDDCNLNGIPDGCESDVFCEVFTGQCPVNPTDEWSCGDNWDLGGQYPDDNTSAQNINVTLDSPDDVFLDVSITIPSLRLLDGSILRITHPDNPPDIGNLAIAGTGNIEIRGLMHLAHGRSVTLTDGIFKIRPGGEFRKDPDSALATNATLSTNELRIESCAPGCTDMGGIMDLSDSMEVAVTGNLTIDGRFLEEPIDCGFGFQGSIAGGHTPPDLRIRNQSVVNVGQGLSLLGSVAFIVSPTDPTTPGVIIGGDWENHSVRPECFVARNGEFLLDNPSPQAAAMIGTIQFVEVGATDVGRIGTVDGAEFAIGGLTIGSGRQVTFRNEFDNNGQGQSSCEEALYVERLTIGNGATLTLDNCRIYYEVLDPPDFDPILIGCGELVPVLGEDPPSTPISEPNGTNKARAISLVPPAAAVAQGSLSAIRVTLSLLHRVSPPYSGGIASDFGIHEGSIRWLGPPIQYLESAASGVPFFASTLQCTPYYHDWSTVGLVHVFGSAIVPSSSYRVQSVADSCLGIESACGAVSEPLLVTTTRWGDVESPYNPPSITVQPDVTDISALVNKFRNAPGAPIKARAMLAGAPGNSFGEITPEVLNVDFGFSHISACVDAFRGVPYPYTIQACP